AEALAAFAPYFRGPPGTCGAAFQAFADIAALVRWRGRFQRQIPRRHFRSAPGTSADFNSARASAWISIGLAAIAESGYLSTRLRPWGRLYFAGIQFLDAAGDFAAPLFFGGRVDGIVKAFQQRTGQGGASLGRQRQRLLEKLGDIGCHGRILAPLHTATARSQISTRCHANREARERRGKPKTADCPAGHFSQSVRSGAPPVNWCQRQRQFKLWHPGRCGPPAKWSLSFLRTHSS